MVELSLHEVARLVDAANAARRPSGAPDPMAEASGADAERQLDACFSIHRRLAVYGTLAPGRPNHHVVAPLGGEWTDGVVEGDLFPVGWGATLGYPAFVPRVGGAVVPIRLLTAPRLEAAWPDLDRFEGPGYQRILVPVFRSDPAGERQLYTVANLYAAADPSPDVPLR